MAFLKRYRELNITVKSRSGAAALLFEFCEAEQQVSFFLNNFEMAVTLVFTYTNFTVPALGRKMH